MKRNLMKTLVLAVLLTLVLLPSAFAKGSQESAAGTITLSVWINNSDSYIGPEEQKLPQEQWYISKAFKRFEAENPGVKIELTVPPDQEGAHQSFKAAGLAGNAPDIANLWSGQPIFALKDVILPLDNLVQAADLKNIWGWESVREGFKSNGTILGYPASQNQLCFFIYNKKIVKDAGLDFEAKPPKTIEEFDAACAKIKAIGKQPIVVDESFPWFYLWIGQYWWAQITGGDVISQETIGLKKFSDDKALIDSLVYYNKLYKNGYLNSDMGTSADSWNRFLQGEAAMYPAVTSFLADAESALGADAGALAPPEFTATAKVKNSLIGGPGQSMVVSKNSKHPELAVKLLSFLNSKKEVLEAQKVMPVPPIRTDLSTQELGWAPNSNISKLFQYSSTYMYWIDNRLTPPVADVYYKQLTLVGLGKMTPQELAAEMDKVSK
ncbi:MAG: extracellular solute-binding protein [Spirochaetales bacterium]|nr:MAG: extracellular solute-binding protein [Spirochaetales bacterium]